MCDGLCVPQSCEAPGITIFTWHGTQSLAETSGT
jgi:hypothetical protein